MSIAMQLMYNYLSQSYLASILYSSQQAWIICISLLRGFYIFRLLHFCRIVEICISSLFSEGELVGCI
jgi:hypothetical protein